MKILIDENLDCRLRLDLQGHDVESVQSMGWSGLNNSDLLERAEKEFGVFITMDSNMLYQKNVSKHNIPIISIKSPTNRLADTRPLMPKVLDILPTIQTWKVMVVS